MFNDGHIVPAHSCLEISRLYDSHAVNEMQSEYNTRSASLKNVRRSSGCRKRDRWADEECVVPSLRRTLNKSSKPGRLQWKQKGTDMVPSAVFFCSITMLASGPFLHFWKGLGESPVFNSACPLQKSKDDALMLFYARALIRHVRRHPTSNDLMYSSG